MHYHLSRAQSLEVGPGFLSVLAGILLMAASCAPGPDKAKSFKSVFDHYRSREEVVAVSFPPGLVGLFLSDSDPDQAELKQLMQELSSFRMLSVSDDTGGAGISGELGAVVSDFTLRNGFQDLFRMQTAEENIFIRILEKNGTIREAVLMLGADNTFFVIDLRGNISMEHFTKLAQEGHLEDLTGLRDLGF